MTCECMTLEMIRVLAAEHGVPGPNVDEHAEDYDGECYCRLCLSYMNDGPCPEHVEPRP